MGKRSIRPQTRAAPVLSGPKSMRPQSIRPHWSMRPKSIRPHFTQNTFYRVRLTYHGPALVDSAPLCIRYISLVILPSYLRLTMVRSWSIRPTLQTRHIYFVILTELPLTYDGPILVDPAHFNCTLRPKVRALTS